MTHSVLLVLCANLALCTSAWAQSGVPTGVAELEATLTDARGIERVRVLASLTRVLRSIGPAEALEYGEEALSLIREHPDPESEVTVLNEMGWALMELGRYSEATEHADRGRVRAEESGRPPGIARALNNLGVIQRRLGGFGLAIDYFRRSLAIRKAIGDESGVATAFNNLSVVFGFDLADYEQALDNQFQALEINERLETDGVYRSYNSLGVIYTNMGEPEQAVVYLEKALAGWRELDLAPRIAASASNLAEALLELGEFERAIEAQREALALREQLQSQSGIALSYHVIGQGQMRLGAFAEAREAIERALSMRGELGERRNVALSMITLAELDRRTGDLSSAERGVTKALEIAQEISARGTERLAYRELATIREVRGDLGGALDAFRAFKVVEDSLFSEHRTRRIDALSAAYEIDRNQREIQRLTATAELATARATRRGAFLIVLILGSTIAFLLYRRRLAVLHTRELTEKVRERTKSLASANVRLEELSLTDDLTGLRNRRFLDQTIHGHMATSLRAHRGRPPGTAPPEDAGIVFYMMDLDDFKSVNDTYGHAAGDRVLEGVARLMEETARASDVLVRWGGEEFLIVSPGLGGEGAAKFADRLRECVQDHVFEVGDGVQVRTTCSVGFSRFPFLPDHPDRVEWSEVVRMADHAAYLAKRSGKNAWVGVSSTPTTPVDSIHTDLASLHEYALAEQISVTSSLDIEGTDLCWGLEGC